MSPLKVIVASAAVAAVSAFAPANAEAATYKAPAAVITAGYDGERAPYADSDTLYVEAGYKSRRHFRGGGRSFKRHGYHGRSFSKRSRFGARKYYGHRGYGLHHKRAFSRHDRHFHHDGAHVGVKKLKRAKKFRKY